MLLMGLGARRERRKGARVVRFRCRCNLDGICDRIWEADGGVDEGEKGDGDGRREMTFINIFFFKLKNLTY